jgi:hypothetical protein
MPIVLMLFLLNISTIFSLQSEFCFLKVNTDTIGNHFERTEIKVQIWLKTNHLYEHSQFWINFFIYFEHKKFFGPLQNLNHDEASLLNYSFTFLSDDGVSIVGGKSLLCVCITLFTGTAIQLS